MALLVLAVIAAGVSPLPSAATVAVSPQRVELPSAVAIREKSGRGLYLSDLRTDLSGYSFRSNVEGEVTIEDMTNWSSSLEGRGLQMVGSSLFAVLLCDIEGQWLRVGGSILISLVRKSDGSEFSDGRSTVWCWDLREPSVVSDLHLNVPRGMMQLDHIVSFELLPGPSGDEGKDRYLSDEEWLLSEGLPSGR